MYRFFWSSPERTVPWYYLRFCRMNPSTSTWHGKPLTQEFWPPFSLEASVRGGCLALHFPMETVNCLSSYIRNIYIYQPETYIRNQGRDERKTDADARKRNCPKHRGVFMEYKKYSTNASSQPLFHKWKYTDWGDWGDQRSQSNGHEKYGTNASAHHLYQWSSREPKHADGDDGAKQRSK